MNANRRVECVSVACVGGLLAGGSLWLMLPYFTGESCSTALLAAPFFVVGLVMAAAGLAPIIKGRR